MTASFICPLVEVITMATNVDMPDFTLPEYSTLSEQTELDFLND